MSFDERGYVLGAGEGTDSWFLDTRMTVKAGFAQTGGAFTLLEFAAPVGFGPPRHVHHVEDEGFYVLDGELVVECGDRRWAAGPGGFVLLPRGIPHDFRVESATPARVLQLGNGSGFERFIAEAGAPAQAPTLPPPPGEAEIARMLATAPKYAIELLPPPAG